MSATYKIGTFKLVLFGALAASFFLIVRPLSAQAAASLYIAPPSGTFVIGGTFTVSIFVNTGGQAINAIETDLSFPPDKLQVISPTTGKSLIQVWVNQPTYSNENGTIKFQGTIPTPGINTDSGLISTVTFRVKSVGTATLRFMDGSRLLLNDGRGTDILGQMTDGIYYLTLPPPQGPIVTSRTNPDQEKWYNTGIAVFEWASPPDIQAYSYILDGNPAGEPDDISEGIKTRVVYNNLADGIHYFHIKSLRQGIWGGVTDYIIKIDNTPPAAFKINFSPDSRTSNHRPIIDFDTTDSMSGMNHYELKVIFLDAPTALVEKNNSAFFVEAIPPYTRNLDLGRYQVIIRGYDAAGNFYQTEGRLSIVKPFLEFFADRGLRIGDVFTISWTYTIILGLILLGLLVYLACKAWRWHREIERHLDCDIHEHPQIAGKWKKLKEKLEEYGLGKHLLVLAVIFALGLGIFAVNHARAESSTDDGVLEPPIVTLFPQSISNDEILYIGGRAGAQNANVLIYLQNVDTRSTLNEATLTDKEGDWFYTFPHFLTAGNYVAWVQLKVGVVSSPPSSRLNLQVARTAIQVGKSRFSYQDFYLGFLIFFAIAFFGLLVFSIYHLHHFRKKNRRLTKAIKETEESMRRGFAIVRHDIESELALVHQARLKKELAAEEKLREEKLVKDLVDVSRYLDKEIWEIEKMEEGP